MLGSLAEALLGELIDAPIFVVGAGRSGTSILLKGLGVHPDILPAEGEAPLLRDIGDVASRFELPPVAEYYTSNLRTPRRYLRGQLRRICFESVHGRYYGLQRIAKDCLRSRWATSKRATRWCSKTFPSESGYHGLRNLFPQARFVYILRNGIDVVHSRTRFEGFNHLTFGEQCTAWADSVACFSYLTDAAETLVVRHEELVRDPDQFFREVFSFVDVGFNPDAVAFVQNNLVHPLDQATKREVDVLAAFEARPPAYGNWSRHQRSTFKSVAGDAMREAGYDIPF